MRPFVACAAHTSRVDVVICVLGVGGEVLAVQGAGACQIVDRSAGLRIAGQQLKPHRYAADCRRADDMSTL